MNRFALVVLAALLGVPLAACLDERPVSNAGANLPFDNQDPASCALRDQGLQLRAAIDRFYVERPAFATDKRSQTDLQHVVERFLPIGIPFDRAERILRYAGFTLAASHDHYPLLYASITPYARTFPLTHLGVSLSPTRELEYVADPMAVDWTIVRGMSAAFSVTWP